MVFGIMQERIEFSNKKGDKLVGILSDPGSKTVVVMCHGFTTGKDSSTNKRLENEFNDKGLATFRFDFFAHGESEGDFKDITISEATEDVLCAIALVRERGYEKVGLVGSSFGGTACILAASQTKELFVVALKAPVSDYKGNLVAHRDVGKWKKDGFVEYISGDGRKHKLDYNFYLDTEKYNEHKEAEKITAPTIIIHGDADESVPIEQSKRLAEIIKHCTLHILPGADHRFSKAEDFEKMIGLLGNFICRHA